MSTRLLIITILAAIGALVASYLLTVHWGWWQAVCLGVGDCESVNTSRWSELLGIPVALLGGLSYLAIIASCILAARDLYADNARLALFFIAAIGVAFSAYLTYIELFVLHAICPWCVLSAILIAAIAILSALELRAA
jgi:uncharacterized membrane protein